MELELTSDQEALRDSIAPVLARECSIASVRKLIEARWHVADAPTDALWSTMVELGWPALTVPEDDGGIGLGAVELAVLAEELGRALAPGPLLPTLSQFVPAVRECGNGGQRARWLGAVASGATTGSLAIAEETGSVDPAAVEAVLAPDGDGFRLTGEKHVVVEGASVDELVVAARLPRSDGDDGVCAVVVPTASAAAEPLTTLDPSRTLATLRFDQVPVDAGRVLGEPGRAAAGLRRAVEEAVAAIAVEMVGTGQTIFDLALAHAKEREQFGVPIGSFQAMKHKFADMFVLLERARATAYFAALCIAENDERRALAASMAKAAAGDMSMRLTQEGIQVLGGIGYTWEHDMHLYVRRLKSGSLLLGTATDHRARVADLLGV